MAEAKGIIAPTLPRSYTDDYGGWVEETARAVDAANETGIAIDTFPEECKRTVAEVLAFSLG